MILEWRLEDTMHVSDSELYSAESETYAVDFS